MSREPGPNPNAPHHSSGPTHHPPPPPATRRPPPATHHLTPTPPPSPRSSASPPRTTTKRKRRCRSVLSTPNSTLEDWVLSWRRRPSVARVWRRPNPRSSQHSTLGGGARRRQRLPTFAPTTTADLSAHHPRYDQFGQLVPPNQQQLPQQPVPQFDPQTGEEIKEEGPAQQLMTGKGGWVSPTPTPGWKQTRVRVERPVSELNDSQPGLVDAARTHCPPRRYLFLISAGHTSPC